MRYLLALAALLIPSLLSAQTLFTYGPHSVTKDEFLWAFRKNNTTPLGSKKKVAVKAYLDLYIDYKLKVEAAREAGYDKTTEFQRELRSFRSQLSDQSLKRLEGAGMLSREALVRGRTDIQLGQIYVGFGGGGDTLGAYRQVQEALTRLQQGEPFGQVAALYGTNPILKENGGNSGYITVFSLPYEVENIVYSLPVGGYSGIYRGPEGYHIFRNMDERPDPGTFKGAQILLAVPPKATQEEADEVGALAQKVRDSLVHGASWDLFVKRYSDDKISFYNKGILPEFTTGHFDPAFEKAAFLLEKDGDISEPVRTAYGWHIIRRDEVLPPLTDSSDTKRWRALEEQVIYGDRMADAQARFSDNILPLVGFHLLPFDSTSLHHYCDTLFRMNGGDEYIKKVPRVALFSMKDTTFYSTDWLRYLYFRRGTEVRKIHPAPYYLFFRDYIRSEAIDVFGAHLDAYDPDFRYQFQEFTEGTLLFTIMQARIWGKAGTDSAALVDWFNAHPGRYWIKYSADVIALSYPDSSETPQLLGNFAKDPAGWRSWLAGFPNVSADSARFDLGALSLDSTDAVPNKATSPVWQPDHNLHFYYVLKTYPSAPAPTYEEAKGQVLNDYQESIEKQWLDALRKQFPVSIQRPVLEQVEKAL